MKKELRDQQGDIKSMSPGLPRSISRLPVQRGVSQCRFLVGATTVRIHELGYADRPPSPDELTA
jgi:hypothetical protein